MTIPAIRVDLNGHTVTVAGAEGLSMLSAKLGMGSGDGSNVDPKNVLFSVMGIDVHSKQPRQLTWATGLALQPGDKLTLEIVKTDDPTLPDQVLSTPNTEQLTAEAKRRRSKPETGND